MRIKRMTATFGGLTEQRLELAPGLNLIQAPNESGKSHLGGLFEGYALWDRHPGPGQEGTSGGQNRYQPWSGAPMEGELLLEWQGRDITIRRGPWGASPSGTFPPSIPAQRSPSPA